MDTSARELGGGNQKRWRLTTQGVSDPDGWMLGLSDSAMSKMMTVGVGHSRRYCNTGYDQSQGRRPSTLKCIGSISQRRFRPEFIVVPHHVNSSGE